MWWAEVLRLQELVTAEIGTSDTQIASTALVEPGAILDDSAGPIIIAAGTRIGAGAVLRGPLIIGSHCLIGNMVMLRGPAKIGNSARIGFATEIKQALIGDRVSIGPQCFVADSQVDSDAYLGAQVRTSNQRLDRAEITIRNESGEVATGSDKLGCWIGSGASLGIQVIVLPGRVIAPNSLFEPRITIARNHPTGHYRVRQAVELVH